METIKMECKECGRLDGLKIMLREKAVVCEQCLAKINGCEHRRFKIYKTPDGGHYSICKNCGERK